eukprot:TRINITY_DN15530_c0_g1_i2.p1 TRINITY_DN15530_c0_g1~~TRINITY_DN15530_c0_g1_i2.p1  ORF type:complete len:313 (-),score=64.07 TRINITY_DN15530_c0_g1_i2:436-1374(-)
MVESFFFFKQKTAYEMLRSLVGSEMCIRDRSRAMSEENTEGGAPEEEGQRPTPRGSIIVSYQSEAESEMLRLVEALEGHFGPSTVFHGLRCRAARFWKDEFFDALAKAGVCLVLLSPGFFKSKACKLKFKTACDRMENVIPVILTALPCKLHELEGCDNSCQVELGRRNCIPRPSEGALVHDFDTHVASLIKLVEEYLGQSSAHNGTSVSNKRPAALAAGPGEGMKRLVDTDWVERELELDATSGEGLKLFNYLCVEMGVATEADLTRLSLGEIRHAEGLLRPVPVGKFKEAVQRIRDAVPEHPPREKRPRS